VAIAGSSLFDPKWCRVKFKSGAASFSCRTSTDAYCVEQFSIFSPGEKRQSKKGMVEILSFSFWQNILHCDSRYEKFSPPSPLTEQNSASVETTTRLRYRQAVTEFPATSRDEFPKQRTSEDGFSGYS